MKCKCRRSSRVHVKGYKVKAHTVKAHDRKAHRKVSHRSGRRSRKGILSFLGI